MDKSQFYVRLKTKDGNLTLKDSISLNNTVLELKTIIYDHVGSTNIKILYGYPPKELNSPNEESIETSGIRAGDVLIIEENNVEQYDMKSINEANTENIEKLCNSETDKEKLSNSDLQSTSYNAQINNKNDTDLKLYSFDSTGQNKGIIMRRDVPSNNSCLFISVGFLISGRIDLTVSDFMRQLIVEAIKKQPEEYNAAILGKPIEEYCEWILLSTSWGGAIEISILSNHYNFEIVVANTSTAILNRFGEDKQYEQRGFLIFDGIHYDPLYMDFMEEERIQTLFPTFNTEVLLEVEQLMMEAKYSKQYTDLHSFKLCCSQCNTLLTGQVDAQNHALATGHSGFNEVDS